MKSKRLIRTILILAILALNIGCDQVTKSLVRTKMEPWSHYGYLNYHVTLNRVENTGAFLSLGDTLSGPVKIILFDVLPMLAILSGLIFILVKTDINRITVLSVILIVGGGFGNIYDRIFRGSVTDFMHINFVIFQTGIFNVADLSITTGVFIILIQALLERKKGLVEN
jgi:signal peptidase II